MKNFYLLFVLFNISICFSQSLPINFEGDITSTDLIGFDQATAVVTANPNPTGINLSANVGQIIRDGGTVYEGGKIILDNNLDFSSLTKIRMKVYTTAPIGTTVKFKLEGAGASAEVDTFTTVSGTWETLEWVFIGTANNLNEIVFMFDFGKVGDGSAASTFYFDDIEQVAGPTPPVPTSLPIDFESGIVNTDFISYSGSNTSIVANPLTESINTSATVGKVTKDGGDFWAGSRVFLTNNLDLTTEWVISMKVYTAAPVGTRIKLELEGVNGKTSLDYLTSKTGEWEVASFNFNGKTTTTYDKINIAFDFGNVGDGTITSIFYFDDIQQHIGPAIPDPLPTTMPIDFENSVVTSDFTNFFGASTTVIPNPQIDNNNPSATVGQFIRSGGDGYMRSKLALTDFIKNMSTLGSISMKVYTDAPVSTLLKFKLESNVADFGKEQDVLTTVSGEWETYTWDLSNGDTPIHNVLTLMLGYNGSNDASANATFLFDDIQQVSNTLSTNKNQFKIEGISASPNPARNQFKITSKRTVINTITIFDILGNQVLALQPNSLKTTINVTQFNNGIYIAKISTAEGIGSLKLLVSN